MIGLYWFVPFQFEVGPSRRYLWESFPRC